MTSEARAWLDATVKRILARYPVGDPERMGLTYELMSHLHGAGEAHAAKAGRGEVLPEDLAAALAESGGESGLAADLVEPLARPLERVLLWRRVGALAIDAVLLLIAVSLIHGPLALILERTVPGPSPAPYDVSSWWIMPIGFHDATLPVLAQAIIALLSAAAVLGYFTWFEGHDGRSPGKRAVGLRVMRVDGRPVTYRDAFVRNFLKLSPVLLVLEAVVMVVAFRESKQRISDRIADTIVVRT